VGWACRCGERLPEPPKCSECGCTYRFDALGELAQDS
jgi:hypothetical protein